MYSMCGFYLLCVFACVFTQLHAADDYFKRARKPPSPKEGRSFSPEENEIVGGLLNVARFHRNPRVVYGAMFLAGIQSNPYLMKVAANILMRYAVMNGTLLPHLERFPDSSSEHEMSRLMDAIERTLDKHQFQFDEPVMQDDKSEDEPLAVKLYKDGYRRWNSYFSRVNSKFRDLSIDDVEETEGEYTTQYVLKPVVVEDSKVEDSIEMSSEEGSGEEDEAPIFGEFYEPDDNQSARSIDSIYLLANE